MPTSVFFQKYLVLNPNFHGGTNARFPPVRTPMRSLTILNHVPQTKASSTHETKKRF